MLHSSLSDLNFCVVDTETTGCGPAYHQIIDIAVFRFQGGEIVEKFDTLINPGRPIPAWISDFTGITDDMVCHAPSFKDVSAQLKSILSKGIFTAHNALFDYGFVREEFARCGEGFEQPSLCTVRLARLLYPELPSRSLGALCESLLIDIWDRHRAKGDAEATVYVLKEMLRLIGRDGGIQSGQDLMNFIQLGPLHLPAGISFQQVLGIPDKPGTFVLQDELGQPVLNGKAKNLQRRFRNMFKRTNQSDKSNHLRRVVRAIEIKTPSLG